MRRRVTAERFRLALKLESRPRLCRVGCEPNGHRMRRRPQTWRKLPFPRTSGPEGSFQERGGRGLSRGPELCRSLRGRWKPRLWWTMRETSCGRDPRAGHLSPRALRVGSGQQAGSGRTPPPPRTPSGPCPFNSAGQGASAGAARPVTWDGPGRLPEHPGGSRAPGGGAQPARGAGKVTWGWFQVVEAAARGWGGGSGGDARTPGRAGRWG